MLDIRYWTGAARSLARNMRDRSFRRELLNAGIALDQRPKGRGESFLAAYPEAQHLSVPSGTFSGAYQTSIRSSSS